MQSWQQKQDKQTSRELTTILGHSVSCELSAVSAQGISGPQSDFQALNFSRDSVSVSQTGPLWDHSLKRSRFGTRPTCFQKLNVYQLIEAPLFSEQISEQWSHGEEALMQNQQSQENAVRSFSNHENKENSKKHQPPLKNPIKNAVKKVNRLLINFLKKEIKSGRFAQGHTEEIQKFVNKELEEKNFLNHTFIKSLILLRKLGFSMQIVRAELLKMLEKSEQKQQKKNARIYRSFMEYKERAILTVISFQKEQLIDCIKFMYNRHPINRITNVLNELQLFEGYTEKYLGSLCTSKTRIIQSK